SWSDQLAQLGEATALAKSLNVTLALRNAPGTFASDTRGCRRVAKEADSAWLRYGPEPSALDAGSDPPELAANAVLLWSQAGDESAIAAILGEFPAFRGHLALDVRNGDASAVQMQNAVHAWRTAFAKKELDRT
ncbi:MAG TPA: hypothetical protein VMH02_01060, partial [Verrucomicrobiae bacterium]|nr:hypothetical protein [Verrucomicrobiae bacterium]